MSTVTVEAIEAIAPGLTFQAVLTRDDFKPGCRGGDGQNHWMVSLTRNGYTFSTEYHQGSGHRVWTKSINDPGQVVCKKGDRVAPTFRISLHLEALLKAHTAPSVPTLQDVLYSLTMDAQGTEYNDFEEWCSEYGYSDDSISAKESYDACCREGKALKKLGFRLEQLSELFQDY